MVADVFGGIFLSISSGLHPSPKMVLLRYPLHQTYVRSKIEWRPQQMIALTKPTATTEELDAAIMKLCLQLKELTRQKMEREQNKRPHLVRVK